MNGIQYFISSFDDNGMIVVLLFEIFEQKLEFNGKGRISFSCAPIS
jgi:hypothetical protein